VRRRQYRRVAPALALVLAATALAGCGGGDTVAAPAATAPVAAPAGAGVDPTESYAALRTSAAHTTEVARALTAALVGPARANDLDTVAAGLPARLVALFTEHVHLTGLAVAISLRAGNADDRTRAALSALDDNAVALGEVLGGYAAANDHHAFLTRWRQWLKDLHIHATEYDPDVRAEAERRLHRHADAAGRSLSRITKGEVSAATATAALRALHQNQLDTVRALRNHDDSAFRRMAATARELNALADALAAGLDKGADLAGDAGSTTAKLHAELTGLMATQIFQARLAQYVAVTNEGGVTGPVHAAATRAIGDTTTRLGELVAREAPSARHPFDRAWSDLTHHLQAYVDAVRAGDQPAREQALSTLRTDPDAISRVLAEARRGSASAALKRALDTHVSALVTAMAAPLA
jgi:hypothetical protein